MGTTFLFLPDLFRSLKTFLSAMIKALLLLGLALVAASELVPLLHLDSATAVPGEYIVVFRPRLNQADIDAHLQGFHSLMSKLL